MSFALWQNSRLYNNGDVKGYLGGLDGQPIPFFAGGMGIENMCGCGVSGSCEDPSYNCNCDIADGKERIDQGVMHEKDYLPISFVSFSEIGVNSTGTYSVGPLQCAEKQFGNTIFSYVHTRSACVITSIIINPNRRIIHFKSMCLNDLVLSSK